MCSMWIRTLRFVRYRTWIHRTRVLLPQLFLQRLNASCIWSDCISGVIVTVAIILSFLSLMTFADFLADQLLRCDDMQRCLELPCYACAVYCGKFSQGALSGWHVSTPF